RMRWDGHRLTAEADIDVAPDLTLTAARDVAHTAERRLTAGVPKLAVAEIHAYPQDDHPHQLTSEILG
ncbi:MAG: hypothetical protein ABIR83_02755, partial [Nakamurella sp.]